MAKDEKSLTTKVATGSPYQLSLGQVNKASTALVKHIQSHVKEREQKSSKKNLLADGDASEDGGEEKEVPIYLQLGTKKHIQDQTRLKPSKISIPHPFNSSDRICLITVDPQRAYKDLVTDSSFPSTLSSRIGRVVGLSKLKAKYKTFETRRQLFAEYDVFLADDRIVENLPQALGKVFYGGKTKRPIPVNLTSGADKPKKDANKVKKEDKDLRIGTPQGVAKEIETALNAAYIHLSPSATSSIRIGKASMTPTQISENIEAVVAKLTEKFVPKGWRGIRSLHIKGPNTMALPIWLADELWSDETEVLEQKWKPPIKEGKPDKSEKKRKWEEWEEELLDEETLAERRANKKGKKSKQGQDGSAKEKKEKAKQNRQKLKEGAMKSIQAPPIAG